MSTERKAQKRRNKYKSASYNHDEGHKTDISEEDEAERKHWHDVSRAFCMYEGLHSLHSC